FLVCFGMRLAPRFNDASLVGTDQLFGSLNDGRKTRFRIDRNVRVCSAAAATSATAASAALNTVEADLRNIALRCDRCEGRTGQGGRGAARLQPKGVIMGCIRAGPAKWMAWGEAHRTAGGAGARGRADKFGQLYSQHDPLRSSEFADGNPW